MIGIVTHTPGTRDALLQRAFKSLQPALEVGGFTHEVRLCKGKLKDWTLARWQALQDFEYVAFLDDDDEVISDVVLDCVRTIGIGAPGAVCSDEEIVRDGAVLSTFRRHGTRYSHLWESPVRLHHLCFIKRAAVPAEVLELALKLNAPVIDWLMKASAALTNGAILVPKVGYRWHVNDGQMTRDARLTEQRNKALPEVMEYLRSLSKNTDIIPSWQQS